MSEEKQSYGDVPRAGENPMQPVVSGYRKLTDDELHLVNQIKSIGPQIEFLANQAKLLPEADQRAIALGLTHLQTGAMWLIRGITRPNGLF